MSHVYHYHANLFECGVSMNTFDGIGQMPEQIADMQGYDALKSLILKAAENGKNRFDSVTITSLSYHGELQSD